MSSSPATPYPPDPEDDAVTPAAFGDLVDVVAEDIDWAGQRAPGLSARRVELRRCTLREATLAAATLQDVELRGCDLAGMIGAEALRGARMPWNDVIENVALLAAVVGIEIVE